MWIYDYNTSEDNPLKDPAFPEITTLSYIDNLSQWSYPYHIHHESYELFYIISGNGYLLSDESFSALSPGSVILVPPMFYHRLTVDASSAPNYYTLRFLKKEDGSPLQNFFMEKGFVHSANNPMESVRYLFNALFSIHHGNGGRADAAFQAAALSLIETTRPMLMNVSPFNNIEEHETASSIMKYIMNTHGVGVTLESLSKHFSISQSHISRIFNNAYHVSPVNYAIISRITWASELLLKCDLPLTEIAESVGYDNPSHFTTMFTKKIGCSPSEYREKNRDIPIDVAH